MSFCSRDDGCQRERCSVGSLHSRGWAHQLVHHSSLHSHYRDGGYVRVFSESQVRGLVFRALSHLQTSVNTLSVASSTDPTPSQPYVQPREYLTIAYFTFQSHASPNWHR